VTTLCCYARKIKQIKSIIEIKKNFISLNKSSTTSGEKRKKLPGQRRGKRRLWGIKEINLPIVVRAGERRKIKKCVRNEFNMDG